MMPTLSLPVLALCLATAPLGFAAGLAYFAALRRSVALFAGGRGWLQPLALTLARLAAATILLGAIARLGALPLLAAFAGFLTARAVSIRLSRETA